MPFKALRLSDPQKLGYTIKWPFHGSHFNTRDYQSHQNLMNDIEALWSETLRARMKIDPKGFKVRLELDTWYNVFHPKTIN